MRRALADVIAAAIMRERDTITRTLQAAGVPDADAEDVAQEVTILAVYAAQQERVAWKRRPTLQRWLFVVAYRHALNYLQRAARRELPHADPEDDRTVPSAEDRYLMRETIRIAAAAPSREDWRALRAWCNGVPTAEIARREGITTRGVYSRIHTARVAIRAALRRGEDAR
jgi:DNA-directed RNA polymerase specialized sigma24 family protein